MSDKLYYIKKVDIEKVKADLIDWIKKYFEENGKDCNAVIGISGGKDSTIAAALCVEALGRDRVIGVLMPDGLQKDIHDSYSVIRALGIKHITINIGSATEAILKSMTEGSILSISDDFKIDISNQTRWNLPPRIRMSTLYAVAQSCNGRVCNTSNLSESYINWFTMFGDGVGDFKPFVNLTSDEVIAIGDLILDLPFELVHKTPSDGLCGQTDEDKFGFSYSVLNKYIRTGECSDLKAKEKIDKMHFSGAFKHKEIPSFNPFRED